MRCDVSDTRSIRSIKRDYHPEGNPLLEGTVVTTREKRISTGMRKELVDPVTGEVSAITALHRVKELDDAHFVKVFSEGVKAMYDLSRTGTRVFQAILDEYQKTKMNGGYADTIYLPWFNEGIDGQNVGMSKRTFNRGLAELIENKFLAPRSPEAYWVNPSLFFKGDRVAFIREYRRKPKRMNGDTTQIPP
jgi:hypothetical protein